jgi:hypothetical protein
VIEVVVDPAAYDRAIRLRLADWWE